MKDTGSKKMIRFPDRYPNEISLREIAKAIGLNKKKQNYYINIKYFQINEWRSNSK